MKAFIKFMIMRKKETSVSMCCYVTARALRKSAPWLRFGERQRQWQIRSDASSSKSRPSAQLADGVAERPAINA
jgi:hypothetical protein